MQLVELVGSHYEVGYAYGALLGIYRGMQDAR